MIWAGQMLLQHFGYTEAAEVLLKSVEKVLARSEPEVLTADMGGKGSTKVLGEAIVNEIKSFQK
jgi:isocitrate/isopropylmalate dehydrogenase